MKSFLPFLILIILQFACKENKQNILGDPNLGITGKYLPSHIKQLYQVKRGTDTAYRQMAVNMYQSYLQQNQIDSAIFCLIAWHEVLDQNYLFDSSALVWAKDLIKKQYGTQANQHELLKLNYYIASMHLTENSLDSAVRWFQFGLNQPNALPRTKAKCRNMLSNVYGFLNKMDSAILLMQENCTYYKSLNDTVNYSISCANLSMDYRYVYAFELAKQYAQESIKMAILKSDTFSMVMGINQYISNILESEIDTPDLKKHVKWINQLMNHYTQPNLALTHAHAKVNMQMHYTLEQYDSMRIWLDTFEVICRKRSESSLFDFYKYNNRYNMALGKPIENKEAFKQIAYQQRTDGEVKGAYADYHILMSDAKKQQDWKTAYAYQDTLSDVEKILLTSNSKGKLYELEIKYKTEIKDQELALKDQEIDARNRNISLLAAVLVIISLLFISYFLWQKQKETNAKKQNEERFSQLLLENTEEERKRIAQDLHDSVGHELLNVKHILSNKIQMAEDKIDGIIKEVREISRNLFPAMFEEVGLKYSLENLADSIYQNEGLYILHEMNYTSGKLPAKVELNIYRIVQEALNNVRKYAQAKSAKITIEERLNSVFVEIKDNGQGFNVAEKMKSNSSFGLISMNQRCKSLGSNLSIISGENGTCVSFEIPL